jgi:PAS domain S-box-containing protein
MSAADLPGGRRALKVLLFEDDPLDAELMLHELEAAGLDVEARRVDTEGAFAFAASEEPAFDLFLLDYEVPGFGGPEALAELRARRPDAPAIIISGKVGEETAIEMLKSGATDYVLKQRLGRLAPAVARALREQALERRRREDEVRLGQLTAEIERNGLTASVFDQLHAAALVAEVPSGRVLLANARAEEMLGPAVRSIAGLADYGRIVLFHPEGRRYAASEIPLARAVRGAEEIRDEPALFFRAGGDLGHALVSAARIHDRRGEGRAAVCVLTEITEQQRLQAALAREREQLASVLAAAVDDAIVGVDPEGRIEIFNVGAERMLDYRAEEIEGRSSILALHDPEEIAAQALDLGVAPGFGVLAEIARQGRPPREWTYVRKDGARLPVSLSLGVRRAEMSGEVVGYVGIARDLSPQRRAEVERAAARAREEEARAALDAVIDAMPVGLAIIDASLCYVRVNAVMAARNGLPAEAHVGRAVVEVLPGAVRAEVEAALRRVLATGAPVNNVELSGFPDGGHWLAGYFPVPGASGHAALGAVGLDISDRRRMEDALRRTAEFRERFVGIVSHDLRSPLQVVLGSVEAVLKRADLPAPLRPPLERASRSGRQMARMIGDLLDITRANLGDGIPIAPRQVDLRELCARTVADISAAHAGRAVDLSAPDRIEACVDPDRFAQVLSNLVVNALKYGKHDAPVRVHLRVEGGGVDLAVCNEGPPVPEELRSRLFDAFTRGGNESEEQAGSVGLGLFIVREIARSHGGRVEMSRSEEGVTCFRVTLPECGSPEGEGRGG